MVLRANVFAKGHSGIRPETLRRLLAALNKNCLPLVPSKGTVGASGTLFVSPQILISRSSISPSLSNCAGDLAPLSHLALGLMGEGQMWDPADETFKPAAQVLQAHGLFRRLASRLLIISIIACSFCFFCLNSWVQTWSQSR